jgi:hypothetical protein
MTFIAFRNKVQCSLSAVHDCCSLSLQKPTIYGGHLLHLQFDDAPCCGNTSDRELLLIRGIIIILTAIYKDGS